jgi:peptidoglycan/LPS O-acetylase OafA/YrhL
LRQIKKWPPVLPVPLSDELYKQKDFYQNRFQYLDVLRGFAVLSVFLTHWGWGGVDQLAWLFQNTFWANRGLHAGVIMFIVLSGFCIHFQQAEAEHNVLANHNIDYWKKYLIRRFFRILPVFLFGCILGIISLCWNAEESFIFFRSVAGFSFVFAWAPYGAPVGNEILCIVQVLCWIYVAYPFMCLGKIIGGWKLVLGFAALFYAVAMCMAYLGIDPTWAGRSFYALFIYWVLGAISAEYWVSYGRTISPKRSGLLIVVSFLLYIGFCHYVNIKGGHYIKSFILALLCAGLLFCVMSAEIKRKSEYTWITKAMSSLGEGSFSLYAVHYPILVVTAYYAAQCKIGNMHAAGYSLISVVMVIAATYFTYRFIELPSHKLAKKIS